MDQLEGLKLYLSVAERDRLDLLNPPEKTPQLFECFLLWALALDVEQQWCDQFNTVLKNADLGGKYTPGWYRGTGAFSSASFATNLGSSLSSTIGSSLEALDSIFGSGDGGGGW